MPVSRTRARSGTEVISRMVAFPATSRITPWSYALRIKRNILGPGRPVPSRYPLLRSWALMNGRRRVGVMGGTFDPVHHGHLVAGSEVAHIFALDEVVFVPTGKPYQKDGRKV